MGRINPISHIETYLFNIYSNIFPYPRFPRGFSFKQAKLVNIVTEIQYSPDLANVNILDSVALTRWTVILD